MMTMTMNKPFTELRDMKTTFCLYTQDQDIKERVERWHSYLFKVPYIKNGQVIAFDLYFDRTAKIQLERLVNANSGTIAY